MREIGVWEHIFGGSEKAGRGTFFRIEKCVKILSLKQSWVLLPTEQVFAL